MNSRKRRDSSEDDAMPPNGPKRKDEGNQPTDAIVEGNRTNPPSGPTSTTQSEVGGTKAVPVKKLGRSPRRVLSNRASAARARKRNKKKYEDLVARTDSEERRNEQLRTLHQRLQSEYERLLQESRGIQEQVASQLGQSGILALEVMRSARNRNGTSQQTAELPSKNAITLPINSQPGTSSHVLSTSLALPSSQAVLNALLQQQHRQQHHHQEQQQPVWNLGAPLQQQFGSLGGALSASALQNFTYQAQTTPQYPHLWSSLQQFNTASGSHLLNYLLANGAAPRLRSDVFPVANRAGLSALNPNLGSLMNLGSHGISGLPGETAASLSGSLAPSQDGPGFAYFPSAAATTSVALPTPQELLLSSEDLRVLGASSSDLSGATQSDARLTPSFVSPHLASASLSLASATVTLQQQQGRQQLLELLLAQLLQQQGRQDSRDDRKPPALPPA